MSRQLYFKIKQYHSEMIYDTIESLPWPTTIGTPTQCALLFCSIGINQYIQNHVSEVAMK